MPPVYDFGVYTAIQDKSQLHKIEIIALNQKCPIKNFVDNVTIDKQIKPVK